MNSHLDAAISTTTATAERLSQAFKAHGFDICQPFHPSWYNNNSDNDSLAPAYSLPQNHGTVAPIASRNDSSIAFLIGNTKRLWPLFLEWYSNESTQQMEEINAHNHETSIEDDDVNVYPTFHSDPLDTFVYHTITHVVQEELVVKNDEDHASQHQEHSQQHSLLSYEIHWDFDYQIPGRSLISMQRAAVVSGLCAYKPITRMVVHPLYGPWISLRAIVVIHFPNDDDDDDDTKQTSATASSPLTPAPPPRQQPAQLPDLALSLETRRRVQELMQQANALLTAAASSTPAIIGKDKDCSCGYGDMDDDSRSLARTTRTTIPNEGVLECWIAARQYITKPSQRAYIFDESQLWYHYTHDPQWLVGVALVTKTRPC